MTDFRLKQTGGGTDKEGGMRHPKDLPGLVRYADREMKKKQNFIK
jgi:hypothetical protein